MLRKTKTVVAVVASTALMMTGCSSAGTTTGSAGTADYAIDGTFTASMVSDPGSLSPLMTASSDARRVLDYMYDRLAFADPATGVLHPWLATAWTEAPSEVTFTMKPGVTCSDGSALTAQTVADNFNFVANKANNSPLRGVFVPADGTATADLATGIVTLKTPEPSPFMLANATSLNIICDAGIKDPKAADAASIGSGLFKLKDVAANDHYTLERRAGYDWAPDGKTTSETPGVPATVIFKVVPNESTSANLLLSGGLNMATINGPDQARVQAANLTTVPIERGIGQMYFNQLAGKATADPAVRIALTAGLDLDNVTKVMTAGKGTRTKQLSTIAPVACTMTTTGALPGFDAAGAAKDLDKAGWKLGGDGKRSKDGKDLKLTLLYEILDDTTTAAAEYAQQQWAKLGVTIVLQGGDSNTVGTKLLSGADNGGWDISWEPILMSTPSPIVSYLSGPAPAEGTNFGSMKNPSYEAAVQKASALVGEPACAAWGEAEKALYATADVVPFASTTVSVFLSKASLAFEKTFFGPSIRLLK
ncbi:ABC transporter substrate-binding protein [Arthrobacter cryoconiti]|uniref:ABC transporter substrate-binding protein n=1 Tax=Arthrobacter cryoconiti TaxID=748907 RepID=A0ABV8R435_9MICC|nr:ABC transporter substrate-binding protein [Arthrobacter cryoconiti]MCC9067110.1 ABC transporter substrate-binding protein [Arthrobacter cryoconiti]